VHISCIKDQQQQQQQPSAAAGSSGSNDCSSIDSSPVYQLLQQWRDANTLPQAQPTWRVQDGGQNPDGSGNGLNPRPGAAGGLVPPGDPKTWKVLGIESSCDDTAAAVITGEGVVLSHRIASQVGVEGGVVEGQGTCLGLCGVSCLMV